MIFSNFIFKLRYILILTLILIFSGCSNSSNNLELNSLDNLSILNNSLENISINNNFNNSFNITNTTSIILIKDSKLKICPSSWHINKMPQILIPNQSIENKEYFMINNSRKNISLYDLNWIKLNCKISSPQIIY